MRKYILPALAMITLFVCSCSTTTTVSHYSTRKATNKTRYVSQSNIVTFPMLVDLDVENRLVTGTYSGTNVNEEFAKSMAMANAIKQASADVLVEPFFDITVTDNNINAVVMGHPAHYKNFRKVPIEDKEAEAKTPSVKKAVVQDKKVEEKKVIEEEVIKAEEKIIEEEPVEEEAEAIIMKPQTTSIEEEEPFAEEEVNTGKLKTPCFLISCAAMAKESDARATANDLSRKGLNANYLWIPDYDRAGKSLYKVYVGPYKTREEAENMLPRVKPHNSGAYVQQLK